MGISRQPGCDALAISCMDFRLQTFLDPWYAAVFGHGNYDRVAIGGGVKDQAAVLAHVDLAVRLHDVRLVLLLNHEDCGAYGVEGTMSRHQADLRAVRARIMATHPELTVVLGVLMLDGTFVHVPGEVGDPQLALPAVVRDGLRG